VTILIDPFARVVREVTAEDATAEALGWRSRFAMYSKLDGFGDLQTDSRATARNTRSSVIERLAGFELPQWTRPSDGAVFERRFYSRGRLETDRPLEALEWLAASVRWIGPR
jgi:hypothetical protein